MNLAISVVYMVSVEHEKLLELHLSRIEQHTTVPYTIYGSANRLLPQYARRLEQHPKVRLCEFPETDLRGSQEHSHYLERLVRLAIEDGASHVATLHFDSFPIRDGWVQTLAGKLSDSCVFSTIQGIDTACLLFHRDFYLNYRPTFLLSAEEQEGPGYKKYLQELRPILHSGAGYGFRAYQHGLSWYFMRATCRSTDSDRPRIYDDLIFHLGGAVRLSDAPSRRIPGFLRRVGYTRFESFQRALRAITPTAVVLFLRARFKRQMESLVDQTRTGWQFGDMASARDRLLRDPGSYIEELRSNGGTRT